MKKFKNLTLFVFTFLLALSSAFIFVGCKKDDNKIVLNEVTHSIFYAPLYVAYNLGYFKDQGLNVTIESATGSDASMTALISGSADIALIGPEQVIYAQGKKNQPVIFGQLTKRDGSFIVGKENSENFSLDDLKGKTIIGGRAGGLPAMTLEYIIKNAGLTIGTDKNAGEVNLRTDVSFPMIGSEFVTSGSEYCTLFEPTATNLQKEGNGYVLDAVGKYSGEVPYTCFVATENYLTKKSDKAQKFLTAVYNGYQYLATNPSIDGAKALKKSFSGMSEEELKIAVEQYMSIDAWSNDLYLKEEAFNKLLDIINTTQNTTYTGDYSKLFNSTFSTKLQKIV